MRSERVHVSERRLAVVPRRRLSAHLAAGTMAARMREVSVSAVISAPREEVFDIVADLAARPTFTGHFMDDYRLARVQPVGVGAAARFKLDSPLANE